MPMCNLSRFVKSLIGMRDLLNFKERSIAVLSEDGFRDYDFHMNDRNKKE